MTRIAAVAPVLPPHVYRQAEITTELAPMLAPEPRQRALLDRMHSGSGIQTRHTVLPIDRYRQLGTFRQSNDLFIEHATDLLEIALRRALDDAGVNAVDVDFMLFTSVTGIAAPSVDGLLISRVGMRPNVKRLPSFGLGCVAGAAGLARVHDYLVGHPTEVGVLLSVELCSLTLQRDDASVANYVATGLFGDGAAAVVLVGDDHPAPGPTIVATRSDFYPDTTGVLAFVAGQTGFEIVLTAEVSAVIERHFTANVDAFLGAHGLTVADVNAWIAHPGGPRVLQAFEASLALAPGTLSPSWDSLSRVGNLSSSSVLHILADGFQQPRDTVGLLFALGPGISAEFVLLAWRD